MVNKYLMFVDERGFNDDNKNFYMIGVIFENNYCIDLENIDSELKIKINQYKSGIFSNDIQDISIEDLFFNKISDENVLKEELQEFVNKLPILFKYLKFDIVISSVKQDGKSINNTYYLTANDLLKKFYSFLVEKGAECGSVIIDGTHIKKGFKRQQRFFNIYNERSINLNKLDDIEDKINSFIVADLNNKNYGLALSMANILGNIIYRGYSKLNKDDKNTAGEDNNIFEMIKKRFIDNEDYFINKSTGISYEEIEKLIAEIEDLKQELELKNFNIDSKEKEIENLSTEIRLLQNRLEKIILAQNSDNIISEILSDIQETSDSEKINIIRN